MSHLTKDLLCKSKDLSSIPEVMLKEERGLGVLVHTWNASYSVEAGGSLGLAVQPTE